MEPDFYKYLDKKHKKYPILFRCAKRSILPSKAGTWEKGVPSSYGQNSAAQSRKIGYFLCSFFRNSL